MQKENEKNEEQQEELLNPEETTEEKVTDSFDENQPLSSVDEKSEEDVILEPLDINSFTQQDNKKKKHASTKIKDLIKKKDDEIADLKDQLLRRRADFENFRRRMETEKTEFLKYALDKALVELLPIIDSFERAMHPDNESQETNHLFDGFNLIYKQLMDFLKKQGVTEILALSQAFDPHYHQAVAKEVKEGTQAGIVIKEYQKGYVYHKRILRPSMVVVSE